MSHLLIKQDNGKYSIWTTVCDNFILVNATKKDLIKYEMEMYNKKYATIRIENNISVSEKRGNTETMKDRLDWIEEIHGNEEMNRVMKVINRNKMRYI